MAWESISTSTYYQDPKTIPTFTKYTNDTSKKQRVTSYTMALGSGKGQYYMSSGKYITGQGSPFTFYVTARHTASSVSVQSTSVTVNNAVDVKEGGTTGSYPTYAQCKYYTVTFPNPITLLPGESVEIIGSSLISANMSGSLILTTAKPTNETYGKRYGTVENIQSIFVCTDSNTWTESKRIWVYDGSAWREGQSINVYNGSAWQTSV